MTRDCSDRELDPAVFDHCRFDHVRFDVYTPVYQKEIAASQTEYVRRVADFDVTRDSTTGWRQPTYVDEDICGILVEKGQPSSFMGIGIAVKLDAAFLTLDYVRVGDQIFDPMYDRYYSVFEEPALVKEGRFKGAAFWVDQLRWLPYYREE